MLREIGESAWHRTSRAHQFIEAEFFATKTEGWFSSSQRHAPQVSSDHAVTRPRALRRCNRSASFPCRRQPTRDSPELVQRGPDEGLSNSFRPTTRQWRIEGPRRDALLGGYRYRDARAPPRLIESLVFPLRFFVNLDRFERLALWICSFSGQS